MIIALRVVIYKNGLDYLLLIDNDVTNWAGQILYLRVFRTFHNLTQQIS
jgi:hypothetical protein